MQAKVAGFVALALVLGVGACSGDDDDASTAPTSREPTTTTEPAPSPERAAISEPCAAYLQSMYAVNAVLRANPLTIDLPIEDARTVAAVRAPAIATHAERISTLTMPEALVGPAATFLDALRAWAEAESTFSTTGEPTGVNETIDEAQRQTDAFHAALQAELDRFPPGPGDPVVAGC